MIEPANAKPRAVAAALTREPGAIDAGIEAFVASMGASAGGPAGTVSEWAAPLLVAMAGLRRHIYLEEVFVFPPVRDGGLVMAIMVMLREHGVLWRAMGELRHLLAAGADDPGRHEERVQRCSAMLDLGEAHNSTEEPILYTGAAAAVPAESRAERQEFLRRGRMPDGWVCERASR